MSTPRTTTTEQALRTAQRYDDLPDITTTDRLALRLGLALLLWGRRHAERTARLLRAERAEQARRHGARERAAAQRDRTFERRHRAGPTW
ncbi:hypothetical protein [uncultured Amnibacterium sp.]|uniref:hypothetical protein n=1 Tax=uncultured Amnibacterium sp. TaxID=1631851 RepID=UPI0035CBD0CD